MCVSGACLCVVCGLVVRAFVVVLCCAVLVKVVCLWVQVVFAEKPCVYIQNVPVCTFKTLPCVLSERPLFFQGA